LRRYRQFLHTLRREYGDIVSFVLLERLKWAVTDLTPKGPPFSDSTDYKVLFNDWPYGLDEKILHLVVWTKFELESDPITDQLTPAGHQQIDDFVQRTFGSQVGPDNVGPPLLMVWLSPLWPPRAAQVTIICKRETCVHARPLSLPPPFELVRAFGALPC